MGTHLKLRHLNLTELTKHVKPFWGRLYMQELNNMIILILKKLSKKTKI